MSIDCENRAAFRAAIVRCFCQLSTVHCPGFSNTRHLHPKSPNNIMHNKKTGLIAYKPSWASKGYSRSASRTTLLSPLGQICSRSLFPLFSILPLRRAHHKLLRLPYKPAHLYTTITELSYFLTLSVARVQIVSPTRL
jgi:hypothetical protein